MSAVVLACPALTSLDVAQCKRLTDAFLTRMPPSVRSRLTRLQTFGCPAIRQPWQGNLSHGDLARVLTESAREVVVPG